MREIGILLAILALASTAGANGPVPEDYPALDYIKAEAGGIRTAGIAMMICGGALTIGGGALVAGNDGADEIVAGASILGSGILITGGGYLITRAHGKLVGWLP